MAKVRVLEKVGAGGGIRPISPPSWLVKGVEKKLRYHRHVNAAKFGEKNKDNKVEDIASVISVVTPLTHTKGVVGILPVGLVIDKENM